MEKLSHNSRQFLFLILFFTVTLAFLYIPATCGQPSRPGGNARPVNWHQQVPPAELMQALVSHGGKCKHLPEQMQPQSKRPQSLQHRTSATPDNDESKGLGKEQTVCHASL